MPRRHTVNTLISIALNTREPESEITQGHLGYFRCYYTECTVVSLLCVFLLIDLLKITEPLMTVSDVEIAGRGLTNKFKESGE